MKKINYFLALVISALLVGCGSGDSDQGLQVGKLSLAITDAPVDNADSVMVRFTGVEVRGQGELTVIDFDEPKTIDLLQLTGSDSESILDATDFPAGSYQWIRLKVEALRNVTDSYIDIESARYSLYIPSGAERGLQLNRSFVIAAGGRTDFTLDFDLRKSVHKPENNDDNYILRPTLRIVDNLEVGHIKGTVTESYLTGETCTEAKAVYLFAGYDAVVDDIDGIELDPITTALIEQNSDAIHEYELGFVEAGDYSVAITCQASNDDPETDDAIEFLNQQNITVTANQTVELDFN